MARADCPICGGMGWKVVEGEQTIDPSVARVSLGAAKQAEIDGVDAFAVEAERGVRIGHPRMAVPCDCTKGDRTEHALARARVPELYRDRDFENYDTDLQYDHRSAKELEDWKHSLAKAKLLVQRFAEEFPVGSELGLLLMGPSGVGKTHLAIAALKEIILRGHRGLFYDYRELLKQIQDSYSAESQATEMGVLEPVLIIEVLVLDDVGSSKPSPWALETVGHILNTRYNKKRVTLLTTNFLDSDPVPNSSPSTPNTRAPGMRAPANDDSLTDRVGKRIRSRLYEMCRTVEMNSADYRKEIRNLSRSASGFSA